MCKLKNSIQYKARTLFLSATDIFFIWIQSQLYIVSAGQI